VTQEKFVFPYALFDHASLKCECTFVDMLNHTHLHLCVDRQGKYDDAVALLDRAGKFTDFEFEC
jgi:hypothetical protein